LTITIKRLYGICMCMQRARVRGQTAKPCIENIYEEQSTMSKLLIVESPTKARTISRMLGKDYNIFASMGHVRDLPEHQFGIDIENNFTPEYVDTPRSRAILKELRAAAARAESVYLATDPDREGEAIAWHLKNALSENMKKPVGFHRVTFHEITRQAIENAIANKGDIDLNLVDAQQARRILDRIVGYQVSPLLWRKLEKGSSAGRVQSAALRIVVERERAIAAFLPEEFWNFSIIFETAGKKQFRSRLFKIDNADFHIANSEQAEAAEKAICNAAGYAVSSVTSQDRRRNPYPPFTTSTLQQAANQQLHYTASSTMRYAQQLYEGIDIGSGTAGLITYMRTDSVTIAKEAQIAAKEFIAENFGKEYLPEKFNFYKNKAAAQEAHEAIRPTDVRRTPEMLAPYLDAQQLKLYTLIWKRFVASQMIFAKQELITADVAINGSDGKEYLFRSTATVTIFPGFLVLSADAKNGEVKNECRPEILKSLKAGEKLSLNEFCKEKKFTEPPPRFTEASLIKQLEENGIGRPSTYATILRTIQDRGYVKREQGKLLPTGTGFEVNDFLVTKLPELFDIGFTAQMEQRLDDIEAGTIGWVEMMTDFYSSFAPWIAAAKESGAPPPEMAEALLEKFNTIEFDPPKKIGARTYDDKKFISSINEKFEKNHKITAKQFQALLAIAARYTAALDINSLPAELQSAIQDAADGLQKKEESLKQRPPTPEGDGYKPVFDAFANVVFPEPRSGRSNFDEEKFFKSLKRQSASGSALSEKQLTALKRLVLKYRAQLLNADKVFELLQMEQPSETAAAEAAASPAEVADAAQILDELSKITKWEAPVKRGRFTFDDKKFYKSIARQHADGKQLSAKQLAALAKLAEKYRNMPADKQ